MNDQCIICDKEILSGDIFMKVKIDMRRLIYNETDNEEDFLVPDGPVHLETKFYLCDVCSQGLMRSAVKDLATAIVESNYGLMISTLKDMAIAIVESKDMKSCDVTTEN